MIKGALRSLVPKEVKKKLYPYLRGQALVLPDGPRVFIFLAADYGNIGDLAISAAQERFIRLHAPARSIVQVPISKTYDLIRSIRAQIRPEDLITVIGGGNMGSLYSGIEELRQYVIRSFPQNRVVCFPQTLDWEDTELSRRALKGIARVYSRHADVHVFARESISYEKLCDLFEGQDGVRVRHVPDIVLSATAVELGVPGGAAPSGILLCLRDDRERSLTASQRSQLEAALAAAEMTVTPTDTHAGGSGLMPDRCFELVVEKVAEFQGAQLVVTDRLHGMILAALAGTPCLVLPNSNHKIRQTWMDWLRDVPQVRFLELDELAGIEVAVHELLAIPRRDPATPVIDLSHYDGLRRAIAHS